MRKNFRLSLIAIIMAFCTTISPSRADLQQTFSGVFDGWLNYTMGTCTGKGTKEISCEGYFENKSSKDRSLATFAVQTGGIRSTAFDKFGLITAFDNHGANYKASSFQAANRTSGETGQFGFALLSGIKMRIVINFDDVDTSATSFARITIPFADEGKANGRKLTLIIKDIAIQ